LKNSIDLRILFINVKRNKCYNLLTSPYNTISSD